MGISVYINISDLEIQAGKEAEVLAVINRMQRNPEIHKFFVKEGKLDGRDLDSGPVPTHRKYSWVMQTTPYEDLKSAFKDWRYDLIGREIKRWTGEKFGSDVCLFMAIAPFMESGGEARIEIEECDELFVYTFNEGRVEEALFYWARGEEQKLKSKPRILPLLPT